ncbi:hypothetical protein V6535_RS22600, partial [Escherichia coli]
ILLRQKQKKLIMLPSETMIWQPEFTDKTLSRKPGAVHSEVLQYSGLFPAPYLQGSDSQPWLFAPWQLPEREAVQGHGWY